ncbi:MAG: anti-sigma factor [Thermoleophilaceae bacterium]|nr:anti-sigma factor [Thermoleophilaceae bacterium]
MNGCQSHADLLGGYVLGALDPAEETEMRRHLEECEECRREYDALAGIPALLDRIVPADVPPPEPSPALEEAVLDRVARERGRSAGPRLAWPPRLALAGAAAAILVAVVVALLLRSPGTDIAYAWGELRGVPGAEGSFTVQQVPAGTQVDLSANGLRRGAPYEVWCVRTDGRWVSGGTFLPRRDGEAEATLTAAVNPGDYHVVVVTRRKRGERGPEVLRGKLRY